MLIDSGGNVLVDVVFVIFLCQVSVCTVVSTSLRLLLTTKSTTCG